MFIRIARTDTEGSSPYRRDKKSMVNQKRIWVFGFFVSGRQKKTKHVSLK